MRYLFLLVVCLGNSFCLSAQTLDLSSVVYEVFHDERVYQKLFVDYKIGDDRFLKNKINLTAEERQQKWGMLRSGRYCIIRLNDIVYNEWPTVTLAIDERTKVKFGWDKVVLAGAPADTVLVARVENLYEAIDDYVTMDVIQIREKQAYLAFHTTSLHNIGRTNYIAVSSELRKRRGRWQVLKLKIKALETCCDQLVKFE